MARGCRSSGVPQRDRGPWAIDAQIEDGLAHLVKALDDVVEGR